MTPEQRKEIDELASIRKRLDDGKSVLEPADWPECYEDAVRLLDEEIDEQRKTVIRLLGISNQDESLVGACKNRMQEVVSLRELIADLEKQLAESHEEVKKWKLACCEREDEEVMTRTEKEALQTKNDALVEALNVEADWLEHRANTGLPAGLAGSEVMRIRAANLREKAIQSSEGQEEEG